MRSSPLHLGRRFAWTISTALLALCFSRPSIAQGSGLQRTFPQSKAAVEQALKTMQGADAGRLPVLGGFANPSDHPLDRYQRGYYQSKIQVSSAPSGGTIVRVTVEVTAWYNDPTGAHSGYQLLPSNGRLEGDILDQLADQLVSGNTQPSTAPARAPVPAPPATAVVATAPTATGPTAAPRATSPAPTVPATRVPAAAPAAAVPVVTASSQLSHQPVASNTANSTEPTVSAPMPRIPDTGGGVLSSLAKGLAEQEKSEGDSAKDKTAEQDQAKLQAEANTLEEIVKNQAHPGNLVAVKKSGTPVVATASLTAKTLFLASAHDEFEMLDFTQDWVHIRISGLSRGWIWRNNVEMPDNIPDSDLPPPSAAAGHAATDVYHVSREEQAPFPGDWAPLRGKTVKIVTVEKIDEGGKDSGPQLRLEFAKSVLEKDYAELAQKAQQLDGIVLIFDSADGGMIAATLPSLQQWKAGSLSDAALWHQCFFDPPESFTASATPASP
jgi:hypothetical protein